MVTSEEIIERTFYISLLYEALNRGLTIDPNKYLVNGKPTETTLTAYEADKKLIGKDFIYIFGIGNNHSRGAKETPRITVESKAYYPGDIGLNKYELERYSGDKDGFQTVEYDFTTKNTLLDIHLVATTQAQMRVLHEIMYRALPAMGYIKPYLNDIEEWKKGGIQSTGNLFIQVGNYYDMPDLTQGNLEKVYTYQVMDGMIYSNGTTDILKPIKDISVLLGSSINNINLDVRGL